MKKYLVGLTLLVFYAAFAFSRGPILTLDCNQPGPTGGLYEECCGEGCSTEEILEVL